MRSILRVSATSNRRRFLALARLITSLRLQAPASPKHIDVGGNASWSYGVFDTIADREPAGSIGLALAA
jgi:hypothetical protein